MLEIFLSHNLLLDNETKCFRVDPSDVLAKKITGCYRRSSLLVGRDHKFMNSTWHDTSRTTMFFSRRVHLHP